MFNSTHGHDLGIAGPLAQVREQLASAARAAGRRPEEITLLGVTKTVAVEQVRAALALGLAQFGENRVQEAQVKILAVSGGRWHLIGHL